ncbi:uncharacterized protein VNE69_02149 [Vairimorpha necatrix]|uniref:Uncharacterized protein n=1 Tax=Vairimorpha necatrix TaxID=6039 RepID=A0AAX4J9I3_9MICR
MFSFILFIHCSSYISNTNEINREVLFVECIEPTIDVMAILAEGVNIASQEEIEDPTIELLFEFLIKGGNLEDYEKSILMAQRHNKTDNVDNYKIIKPKNISTNLISQLDEMKEKFDCIKNEFHVRFTNNYNIEVKIESNNEEIKEINDNRRYLRKLFNNYHKELSDNTENIKYDLIVLGFPENLFLISALDFIKDVCDFVIPKKNNLSLYYNSGNLIKQFELEVWKIKELTENINIPSLIDSMINTFKNKTNEYKEIFNDLGWLKLSFNRFYTHKEEICSQLLKICQKIQKLIVIKEYLP